MWLTVVRKPEHSRVRHLQIHLRIFAVHTDLTESECHALHHYAEQNACPEADCCCAIQQYELQNQKTAGFFAFSYTYGFLLCIQTWLTQCGMHCITVESKVPALWLTAVVQNQKTAGFCACSCTYGFLLCTQTWLT